MHALGTDAAREILRVDLFRALGRISSHFERELCVRATKREADDRDEPGYAIRLISPVMT